MPAVLGGSRGRSVAGADGIGAWSPEALITRSSQMGSSSGGLSAKDAGSHDVRAGERGGGSEGSPRCLRILLMTEGSEMKARMTITAEQRGHLRA